MSCTQEVIIHKSSIPLWMPSAHKTQMCKQFECDNFVKKKFQISNNCSVSTTLHKNVEVQTIFRDSETQTSPWDPPYKINPGHNPEVLTLANFTWDNGLPAGLYELKAINRIRMEKAWESIIPLLNKAENVKARTTIITALKIDEWTFRESEIAVIMETRIQLMNEMMLKRETERKKIIECKFKNLRDFREKIKNDKIDKVRLNLERDLRKLRRKHENKLRADKSLMISSCSKTKISNPYRPATLLLASRKYPKLLIKNSLDEAHFEYEEMKKYTRHWIPMLKELEEKKCHINYLGNLCTREMKWRRHKLQNLQTDLDFLQKKIQSTSDDLPTLMKRTHRELFTLSTPIRANAQCIKNYLNESSLYIQKIIKGRAIQCMLYEKKSRNAKLIEELQSGHGFKKLFDEKDNTEKLQSEYNDQIGEALDSFEEADVGESLSLFSEKLMEIEEQKADALSDEKKRELEYNSRRRFDEIFKQIIKVNQDSTENYLNNIIKEEIKWASINETEQYIQRLANVVEKITIDTAESLTNLNNEEMIADMIYNFVLTETEKFNLRKHIKEKQQYYLYQIRTVIYDELLNLLSNKFDIHPNTRDSINKLLKDTLI
ncbi:cilia- and flagella-associated protein 91 [Prorops nasuta]|uniref:cilia- and flagella-associated protein 91 n=1 Tax=Prorops nasuta TaxID=863751 RepID=UPI0034CFF1A4